MPYRIFKTIHIIAPTVLYLKLAAGKSSHSGAWFTSASEVVEVQNLDWEGRRMGGTITWWLGDNVIEIVHSSETVTE